MTVANWISLSIQAVTLLVSLGATIAFLTSRLTKIETKLDSHTELIAERFRGSYRAYEQLQSQVTKEMVALDVKIEENIRDRRELCRKAEVTARGLEVCQAKHELCPGKLRAESEA
jgi:hypothetical protein